MSPNYTYFINGNSVNPAGEWSLGVKKASEDFPFCKDYRIKLEGELIFSGVDYDLLKSFDCCEELKFDIYCNEVLYWTGYFNYPLNFEFDEDLCQAKGTPGARDKYYYYDLYADLEKEIAPTDTFTYQRNFPALPAEWFMGCIPCEPLWDIITYLGKTVPLWPIGYTTNVKSAFFNDSDDGFPSGPYPVANGINYVTGFANKLKHVIMAMTDEVCSLGVTVGTWPSWSWNDLMDILHNEFNTWWYIDENGDVRIEHISFWGLYFGVNYDLTTINNGHWIKDSSKYRYTVEEMPQSESWELSEFHRIAAPNWGPSGFTYYNCRLPKNQSYIKTYELGNLASDFEYIAPGAIGSHLELSPDDCADIPSGSYMFLRCIEDTDVPFGADYPALPGCNPDYVVWFSIYQPEDPHERLNAHLSSVNLLINYWFHDRPFWDGYLGISGRDVIFYSTEYIMKQIEIFFPSCCDNALISLITGGLGQPILYEFGINMNKFIKTQYGNGEIYTGNINSGNFAVELIFENNCLPDGEATTWPNKEYY